MKGLEKKIYFHFASINIILFLYLILLASNSKKDYALFIFLIFTLFIIIIIITDIKNKINYCLTIKDDQRLSDKEFKIEHIKKLKSYFYMNEDEINKEMQKEKNDIKIITALVLSSIFVFLVVIFFK